MEKFNEQMYNILYPKQKTGMEQIQEYIASNPAAVGKGIALGVGTWYYLPLVVAVIGWVPYIGLGVCVYKYTTAAGKTYTWYSWAKDQYYGTDQEPVYFEDLREGLLRLIGQ